MDIDIQCTHRLILLPTAELINIFFQGVNETPSPHPHQLCPRLVSRALSVEHAVILVYSVPDTCVPVM
ncbi:hypothetical protein J6590_043431 [Homalodisca vitripennis]|nr:hypothetical protein J6590_043431 [Homalodisca vitripennis]